MSSTAVFPASRRSLSFFPGKRVGFFEVSQPPEGDAEPGDSASDFKMAAAAAEAAAEAAAGRLQPGGPSGSCSPPAAPGLRMRSRAESATNPVSAGRAAARRAGPESGPWGAAGRFGFRALIKGVHRACLRPPRFRLVSRGSSTGGQSRTPPLCPQLCHVPARAAGSRHQAGRSPSSRLRVLGPCPQAEATEEGSHC